MTEPVELDVERIVAVLNEHGVRYVVIGGFAAVLQGLARTTDDLDITPSTEHDNLDRLAAALKALEAKLLPPAAAPVDWPWSADTLASFTSVTTRTVAGDLDLCLRPDAPAGRVFTYEELAERALVICLPPDIPVADLADVVASKEAANRPKDHAMLPELRDLLARRASRGD